MANNKEVILILRNNGCTLKIISLVCSTSTIEYDALTTFSVAIVRVPVIYKKVYPPMTLKRQ